MKHRYQKSRSRKSGRIAKIVAARVLTYSDTGQVQAQVDWVDDAGQRGTTSGSPASVHLQQLLARAEREGVKVHHEQSGRTR